ncbi:hypothetical protein G6L85_11525 [Agrobacterium rhizogenes]|uniref:hypothetical protein n=1 Tax=Rhizobium rhizogenes TaxID=359 RepID=UPI001573D86C|nr:hypothetical protein [Rhizobium rhizogenes]NTI62134.1 hypothetical protein [Rhizobium rhizogenes]
MIQLLNFLWRYILKPIGTLIGTIGTILGLILDLPQVIDEAKKSGLAVALWPLGTATWNILNQNALLSFGCLLLIALAFHIFIYEPYRYAREAEDQHIGQRRGADEEGNQ